jgi:formylglycine-generating enzyme required for sulfatase activity
MNQDFSDHYSAQQQVERFVQRFVPSYQRLAYYAALPSVLTPELVHYLWSQFLRQHKVPWVAQVDLLLSDLCNPVGYEQYAIEPRVRAYLLAGMEAEIGKEQMEAVARLLLSYVRQLAQANPETLRHQELEFQQWSAMSCLADQRESMVEQLAQAFQKCVDCSQLDTEMAGKLQSDLDRLVRITQELSPQLKEYSSLLEYASLLQRLLNEGESIDPELLQRRFLVAPGVELVVPSVLIPGIEIENEDENGFWQLDDFEVVTIVPFTLKPFKFETATITVKSLTLEEIFKVVNTVIQAHTGENLTALQRKIIEGTWNKLTYAKIADTQGLPVSYVSKIGATLFQYLSEELGESISKTNAIAVFRGIIEKPLIKKSAGQAWRFEDSLSDGIDLEMVKIPAGEFLMGSLESELESRVNERPQHLVTVPEFYMGRYPITQSQWRSIASRPQITREINPEPSRFKGDKLPIENVSWNDATEFCQRLSTLTGQSYRLPSEAEWEYACRAGTTTPFHFGETISTEVANYNGDYVYGKGVKGVSQNQTNSVGSFKVANAFGLYDMHGNVWEFCQDNWHNSYEGAPIDGSAWIDFEEINNNVYVLRGGSWFGNPDVCRSAFRSRNGSDYFNNNVGFRVVYAPARTL